MPGLVRLTPFNSRNYRIAESPNRRGAHFDRIANREALPRDSARFGQPWLWRLQPGHPPAAVTHGPGAGCATTVAATCCARRKSRGAAGFPRPPRSRLTGGAPMAPRAAQCRTARRRQRGWAHLESESVADRRRCVRQDSAASSSLARQLRFFGWIRLRVGENGNLIPFRFASLVL